MNPNNNIPQWLKNTEQNSWQIELLISGGMIFTLLKIPEYFINKIQGTFITVEFTTSHAVVFFGGITLSRALLIGFSVNLLLRALWLAFLGIHFAYPNGVDYERLGYSKYFEKKFRPKYNLVDRILSIEKYCSLAFSISIIMTLGTIGGLLNVFLLYYFIFEPFFPGDWIDNPEVGYAIGFLLIFISAGLLDRIFFKWLKRFETIQRIYYPISRLLAFLNFTWISKYEWKTLISNSKRWKVHSVFFLYFFLAFLISVKDYGMESFFSIPIKTHFFDEREFTNPTTLLQMQNDEYDEYLSEDDLLDAASIPTEIVKGSYLPFFIVYNDIFDSTFIKFAKRDSVKLLWNELQRNTERDSNSVKFNKILSDCFYVELNKQKIEDLRWYYREHPVTNQLGYHTKIDIDTLPRGEHELLAKFIYLNNKMELDTGHLRKIPFWKE